MNLGFAGQRGLSQSRKQVREVWKIPRIPPQASPSEEYSEFLGFSSLLTQDYIKPCQAQQGVRAITPVYIIEWINILGPSLRYM